MTASDEPRFNRAYVDLFAALGRDGDKEQRRLWFEDFAEFDIREVEHAFTVLRRTATRYAPTPGLIREQLAKQRQSAPLASVDAQFVAELLARGEYACPSCEDSGWIPVTDAGDVLSILESLTWRDAHGYRPRVRRCSCVAHNPVLAAARAEAAKSAWKQDGDWRG